MREIKRREAKVLLDGWYEVEEGGWKKPEQND
jgi:hypothetical protein